MSAGRFQHGRWRRRLLRRLGLNGAICTMGTVRSEPSRYLYTWIVEFKSRAIRLFVLFLLEKEVFFPVRGD